MQINTTERHDCEGKEWAGLIGCLIYDRYRVCSIIHESKSGDKIYFVRDTKKDIYSDDQAFVMKISLDMEKIPDEIQTMDKVRSVFKNNLHALTEETANLGIPDVKEFGILLLDNFKETDALQEKSKCCAYFIMPFYDQSLKSYLTKFDGVDKQEQILAISQQIINILRFIHSDKRAFNGIRPENVRIDTQEDGRPKVFLIDFSHATKFVKENSNDHIECTQTQPDNIQLLPNDFAFSSLQRMKNLKTGRNDDIISLFYLLVFLANGDKIPQLEHIQDSLIQDAIADKENQSLVKILSTFEHETTEYNGSDEFQEAKDVTFHNLRKFVDYVDKCSFDEKPHYNSLIKCLKKSQKVLQMAAHLQYNAAPC